MVRTTVKFHTMTPVIYVVAELHIFRALHGADNLHPRQGEFGSDIVVPTEGQWRYNRHGNVCARRAAACF